jgi:rubrerythrin
MDRSLYRELWDMRFRKMLELEESGVHAYEGLLAELRRAQREHALVPHLERLIADEKKHALLVRELLEILERQPA